MVIGDSQNEFFFPTLTLVTNSYIIPMLTCLIIYIVNTCIIKDAVKFEDVTCCNLPDGLAQSVACLTADRCLTADPGVVSWIPARSHTFVEIGYEILSMAILLPAADSVTSESMCTKYWLTT